jgi:hypothetical protein
MRSKGPVQEARPNPGNGHLSSHPRDLAEIERDEEWLTRNNVDLHEAIVTMISLHHNTAS